MSLPDKCPFCGSGSEVKNLEKWVGFTCITTIHAGHDARRFQSATCAGLERTRLLARVAELEALNKRLEEAGDAARSSLAAKDARIELRRLENEAVRRQLGHAENACDAMEKRVAELDARCKRLEEALKECDRGFTKHRPDEWSTNGASWKAVREALGEPNPWEKSTP